MSVKQHGTLDATNYKPVTDPNSSSGAPHLGVVLPGNPSGCVLCGSGTEVHGKAPTGIPAPARSDWYQIVNGSSGCYLNGNPVTGLVFTYTSTVDAGPKSTTGLLPTTSDWYMYDCPGQPGSAPDAYNEFKDNRTFTTSIRDSGGNTISDTVDWNSKFDAHYDPAASPTWSLVGSSTPSFWTP